MTFDLERFVDAQRDFYDQALREIARGRKQSHWIWFVFPQMAGLGRSRVSQKFAIRSLEEARAYLAHPVLGPRLRECVATLQDLPMSEPTVVFGSLDARKVCSSLTLFTHADPADGLFSAALERWYKGQEDSRTLELIAPQ